MRRRLVAQIAAVILIPGLVVAGDAYATRSIQAGKGPVAVSLADFDGDGRGDVTVASIGDSTVQSHPSKTPTPIILSTAGGPYEIVAQDLDVDGSVEMIVPCYFGDKLQLYSSRKRPLFPAGTVKSKHGPMDVIAADLNGDHKPDLISTNLPSGTVIAHIQDSPLKFHQAARFEVAQPTATAASDFNGDGLIDIAVLNSQSDSVDIFMAKEGGVYAEAKSISVGASPAGLVVADLNADKLPDLVIALNSVTGAEILLSKSSAPGSFDPVKSLMLPAPSNAVVAAHLDGDALLDLAFTQPSTNKIAILHGKAGGAFESLELFETGKNPTAIAAGDINGDGKMDLATANFSDDTVTVLTRR